MRFPLIAALLALATIASAQSTSPRHGFNWDNNEQMNRNISKLDSRLPLGGGQKAVTDIYFCGNPGNGAGGSTDYLSGGALGTPIITSLLSLGSTACSAEDSATEATADEVFYKGALRVLSLCCEVSTSGSNGATFTARSAAADLSPSLTFTIPTGATTGCAFPASYTTAPTIAAAATIAVKVVDTEDLSAADSLCVMRVELQ